jgi:putative transposase
MFAFFIVELGSRHVVHVGVTRAPSDAWVAQQLREATPFGTGSKYLIRDNDDKFGPQFKRAAAGIKLLKTPVRAPKANAICERFPGSVRRECHLQCIVTDYVAYFNQIRPHPGIGQHIPDFMGHAVPVESPGRPVVSVQVLGGLHHTYSRAT